MERPVSELTLCPLDDRRSVAEIAVKTFVVHFTAIAAFAHLLNLRHEAVVGWKLVYFVLAPWAFLFQHVVSLFLILVIAILQLCFPNWYPPSAWDALCCLVGTLQPPDALDQPTPDQSRQKFWTRFGQPALAIGFVTQCACSVHLYRRRIAFDPDAATLADQKAFELASSGLLVGAAWLALKVGVKPFALEMPWRYQEWMHDRLGGHHRQYSAPRPPSTLTPLEVLVCLARDMSMVSRYQYQVDPMSSFNALSFANNLAMALIVALVSGQLDFTGLDRKRLLALAGYLLFGLFAFAAVFIFCFFIPINSCVEYVNQGQYKAPSSRPSLRPTSQPKSYLGIIADHIKNTVPIYAPLFPVFGVAVMFALVASGMYAWRFIALGQQLRELKGWPENTRCPLLWSDKTANWVWALA